MRNVIDLQMKIGEKHISDVEIDLRSRDEIPKVLIGLQHVYNDKESREQVFEILKEMIPEGKDPNNGRPGMDLWKILVLGILRLSCHWDYDKVKEIADNHRTVREMMGLCSSDTSKFALQTIKDNVSLFTQEISDKISQIVVKAGHKVVGKKEGEVLRGRCDSFPVETNVHFPTDTILLWDAIRKVILLTAMLCSKIGVSGWRNKKYYLSEIKMLYNQIRKLKSLSSKNEEKSEIRKKEIVEKHRSYIEIISSFIEKAKITLWTLRESGKGEISDIILIEGYIFHAENLTGQIRRRVIEGETIPHCEKIFSIFEEFTRWIVKGKAGVAQELGLPVCILEDQFGFILYHLVMEVETDDKVTVPMVLGAQERFPDLKVCSFDKGFYSPGNREELQGILNVTVLPKKGRLSLEDEKIEYSEEFIRLRKKHSAVESAINALENHGLDRCPDHGITGFKRYVGLAILARNLQILGHLVQQKELKSQRRRERYRKTYEAKRAA